MPKLATQQAVKKSRSRWPIVIGVAAVLCAAIAAFLLLSGIWNRFEPPVIHGVQAEVVVFEDDDIQTALLAGVTAVGGEDRPSETFPVTVTAYQDSGLSLIHILTPSPLSWLLPTQEPALLSWRRAGMVGTR